MEKRTIIVNKQEKDVSLLGFGCMRFPMKDGEVDIPESKRMVKYALSKGVNYIDTAWPYHGGKSELIVKEIIKVVEENQIKGIIIGNPINMDGTSSQSSQSAKDLAISLSKDVTENVTLWDERLSSQGAFNLSNDLASNTSKKVSKLDENSAQFILQGALDYLTRENT